MTHFNLEFIEESFQYDEPVAIGKITIGKFNEQFLSPISFWKQEDYFKNWIIQIENLNDNKGRIFLPTSMYNSVQTNFIFGWSIHIYKEVAYCQNNILFLDEIQGEFEASKVSSYVKERETVSGGGQIISEWKTDITGIANFKHELYTRL